MRQGAGAGAAGEGEACPRTGAEWVEMGDEEGTDGGRKDRTGQSVDLNLRHSVGRVLLFMPDLPIPAPRGPRVLCLRQCLRVHRARDVNCFFEKRFGVDHLSSYLGVWDFPTLIPHQLFGAKRSKSSPGRSNGKAFQEEKNPFAKHRALQQRELAPPVIGQVKAALLSLELVHRFKVI